MPPSRFSTPLLSRLRTRHASSSAAPTLGRTLLFALPPVLVTAHVFVNYVYHVSSTTGISMVPTIPHSYRSPPIILESRLHRRGRNIVVGDVITFVYPVNPAVRSCKRVIGMPGDFVSVLSAGKTDDDLHKSDEEGEWARVREEVIRVPEGHCWVAGDNLDWSRDSRVFGAVPLGLVRGKVLAVVWPWREMKWLGNGLVDAQKEEHEWVVAR